MGVQESASVCRVCENALHAASVVVSSFVSSGDEGAPERSAVIGKHGLLDESERIVEFAAVILDEFIQRSVKQLLRTFAADGGKHLRSLDILCIQPCCLRGRHPLTPCDGVTQ